MKSFPFRRFEAWNAIKSGRAVRIGVLLGPDLICRVGIGLDDLTPFSIDEAARLSAYFDKKAKTFGGDGSPLANIAKLLRNAAGEARRQQVEIDNAGMEPSA